MAIKIIQLNDQAKGSFAGGAILENKPIGFPQDGGEQKPYSNLFYWANAWSDRGGLIGEHPHKMFEIMSFVIEGEIQHYDNKHKRWLSLQKGDAQIIRAGNGITHAEKIMEGGRMFQIWFDPNIAKSVEKEASYNDYKSAQMKVCDVNGVLTKNYTGNGGPMQMDAEGVVINELRMDKGIYSIPLNEHKIHSYYLIKGALELEGQSLKENDFFKVDAQNQLQLKALSELTLFHIETLAALSYKTYNELVKF